MTLLLRLLDPFKAQNQLNRWRHPRHLRSFRMMKVSCTEHWKSKCHQCRDEVWYYYPRRSDQGAVGSRDCHFRCCCSLFYCVMGMVLILWFVRRLCCGRRRELRESHWYRGQGQTVDLLHEMRTMDDADTLISSMRAWNVLSIVSPLSWNLIGLRERQL